MVVLYHVVTPFFSPIRNANFTRNNRAVVTPKLGFRTPRFPPKWVAKDLDLFLDAIELHQFLGIPVHELHIVIYITIYVYIYILCHIYIYTI